MIGDPAKMDETFLSGNQARAILGISRQQLSTYVNNRDLTCYQTIPGRSHHRFDPQEVRILKIKRERLKRVRASQTEYLDWYADACGKTRKRRTDQRTLHESDLKPREREMGEWITARQAAALLGNTTAAVYGLRMRGYLYGEKRYIRRMKDRVRLTYFRYKDVLALRDDPEYQRGRAHHAAHCSPLARQRKAQNTRALSAPAVPPLDWETPGSHRTVLENNG